VSDLLGAYGLFLAELVTLAALVVAVAMIIAASRKGGHPEGFVVEHLNRRFENLSDEVRRTVEGKARFRVAAKARRKARKLEERARAKQEHLRPRLFVLDFKGDLRASAGASLREEVSAVISVASPDDEVLLRLENSGGAVHEHGFAASQLLRLKAGGLKLMVAVDKVAASGGYLMACVADRLMAAPFAIVGSIGVLVQLPNFHRLLEDKGIDFEQVTAGRFKRTLTMFGENTPEGREKVREEVEDVHALFKSQIREHRPAVDLERVATGEYWYGVRALELGLVDELTTSDDFLRKAATERDIYRITFRRRRSWQERALGSVESLLRR
jgi:serine protease SohB